MVNIIRNIFSLNLSALRFLGFYGPKNMTNWYKLKGWLCYVFLVLPIPIFGGLHLLLQDNLNIVEEAGNIFSVVELSRCIVKFWPFLFKRHEIKKCVMFFEDPNFEEFYNSDQSHEIFEYSKIIFTKFTKIYIGILMFSLSTFWIEPLFWEERALPLALWLPFDGISVLYFYIPLYVFMVIATAYIVFVVTVSDPLVAGLAYQATNHLKVLKYNLQNLSEFAEGKVKDLQSSQEKTVKKNIIIYERITFCIDHHIAILQFVNYYENTFSLVLFVQFLVSSFVICLACFQLTMLEPGTVMFFIMMMYVVSMLAELFFYCFIGHTLTHESNTLSTAIYMGTWYEYDLKSQRALLILMERTKKPMVVTAGKLLDFSMDTFTSIIRKSYSLLAFLNNDTT